MQLISSFVPHTVLDDLFHMVACFYAVEQGSATYYGPRAGCGPPSKTIPLQTLCSNCMARLAVLYFYESALLATSCIA